MTEKTPFRDRLWTAKAPLVSPNPECRSLTSGFFVLMMARHMTTKVIPSSQEALAEGHDIGPIHVGPDGGIQIAQPDPEPPLRAPMLCTVGPCVRYMEFVGELEGMNRSAPIRRRYCFPEPGTEMELRTGIVECNRYRPVPDRLKSAIEDDREGAMATAEGKAFVLARDAWLEQCAKERADLIASAATTDPPEATETINTTNDLSGGTLL